MTTRPLVEIEFPDSDGHQLRIFPGDNEETLKSSGKEEWVQTYYLDKNKEYGLFQVFKSKFQGICVTKGEKMV